MHEKLLELDYMHENQTHIFLKKNKNLFLDFFLDFFYVSEEIGYS